MNLIEILLIFFILNLFLIINFDKIRLFKIVYDKPDKLRKFHKNNVALAGGIILFINIVFYFFFINLNLNLISEEIIFKNLNQFNYFTLTCLLIFILGFIDDKIDLTPTIKFLLLILILVNYIFFDESILIKTIELSFTENSYNIGKYSFIFTLFCFLVFLNAFNMFDGINLQSSSYSFIILIYFFYFGAKLILLYFLIIFILFFMYLNYFNKSFLGDSGTLLISFIISVIFIKFFNEKIILHSDEILIYMLIPGIDMIRLFFERIKNGRNPFSFDRLHLHHLLLEKHGYVKTIFIINLFILIPIFCNHLGIIKPIIIFATLLSYFFLIWFLKKR